jgi:hypothetical protein
MQGEEVGQDGSGNTGEQAPLERQSLILANELQTGADQVCNVGSNNTGKRAVIILSWLGVVM